MVEEKTTIIESTKTVEKEETTGKENEGEDIQSTEPKPKSRSTALILSIFVLVVVLGLLVYFVFIKEKGPTGTGGNEQIQQMQELAEQVRTKEVDVKKKESEMVDLMQQYKQESKGQTLGVNPMDLKPEERKLLEQKIAEEKNVSIKSLLEEINDKTKEIQDLKQEITEIEAKLPSPHVVKEGENHFQIAMDFLMKEKNLDKEQAAKLVRQTLLMDTLIPGFKVWNFYTGDAYGTSVTQGTASISPNTLVRTARKKLEDSRDEAISQRDQLSADIKTLEEKRDEIIRQLDILTKEKENLISQLTELNQQVNSVFYLVDTEQNLKKKGILKGGFLKSTKLRDVSPEHFTKSIDLRAAEQISISASELGLQKIKSVTLFPKFYVAGTDYTIEITADKQTALLTILIGGKFKNERLVLSVK